MDLQDISFDAQDANLFLVDDAQLRADAIKHSILPRLQAVMNEAIAAIRTVYGIEVLDDSIISKYPNFRPKRDTKIEHYYDYAFVGIGGKRKNIWPGFSRRDGKPVQILPFRYAFVLDENGVFIALENGWLKGLSDHSFRSMLQMHIDHEEIVMALQLMASTAPDRIFEEQGRLIFSMRKHYQYCIEHKVWDVNHIGQIMHFPVAEPQLRGLIDAYVYLYPIYDSYIQLAKGNPIRLTELVDRLGKWMLKDAAEAHDRGDVPEVPDGDSIRAAREAAEMKVQVMPALRWQVFSRDGWRCVSCGRSSHDDVILHVDHILPRSLGGSDALDNFQTLCDRCNLGKSNRDRTDLRKSSGQGA